MLQHLFLARDRPVPIKPNLDVKQVIAVGGWYLWWLWHQFTHYGKPPPPARWPIYVLAITNNFQEANMKKQNVQEQRWIKPEPRFVKLNVDAAFQLDEGAGATPVVLRDNNGNFLAA